MKTTIEISDALLETAKREAAARGTTLRALVEDGLRAVLGTGAPARGFSLRDASVDGGGVRAEVREGGWNRVLDLIYDEHGA